MIKHSSRALFSEEKACEEKACEEKACEEKTGYRKCKAIEAIM